mgnify:CR=1 FL=1
MIDNLKAKGLYENTIFVVTSDNGPEPSRGDDNWQLALWMKVNGYRTGMKNIGEKGSWGFIGPEWAFAAASRSWRSASCAAVRTPGCWTLTAGTQCTGRA